MQKYANYSTILNETILTLSSNRTGYLELFLDTFNLILPLLLFIFSLIGIYIYYNRRKHIVTYKFEDRHQIDTSIKSTDNLITNYNSLFYLIKVSITNYIPWLILIIFLSITYAIAGIIGVKILIAFLTSLHIAITFKLYSRLYKIEIEEGNRNFGYISLNILLLSFIKIFIYAYSKAYIVFKISYFHPVRSTLDRLSAKGIIRKIVYPLVIMLHLLFYVALAIIVVIQYSVHLLFYALIPIFFIITSFKLFIIYEFLLLFYHLIKCMPLYQLTRSMIKEPMFVNLEMMNGETIENMVLYQTTISDYRVKGYITHKEYIVPSCAVKSISEDYQFKLKDLESVINREYILPLENANLGPEKKIVEFFINLVIKKLIQHIWYEKAKIHLKMNELNLSKKSLEKALESVKDNKSAYNNFMHLLRTDIEVDYIRNEEWFIQLLNQPYEE